MAQDEGYILPFNTMIGLAKDVEDIDIELKTLSFIPQSNVEGIPCSGFEFQTQHEWVNRRDFEEDVQKIKNFCNSTNNKVSACIYGWFCVEPDKSSKDFVGNPVRVTFNEIPDEPLKYNTDDYKIEERPENFPKIGRAHV